MYQAIDTGLAGEACNPSGTVSVYRIKPLPAAIIENTDQIDDGV